MRIKKINLYTDKLALEKEFYAKTLGFELVKEEHTFFTIKIGWTELSFTESDHSHIYHYCFLIPSNQLNEALAWLELRREVIDIENGRKIENFATWNADSFYFYDASGNLAEFIVRYDLSNTNDSPFQSSSVSGVNEIGMPTSNIENMNSELNNYFGTDFWQGDLKRFGTHGDQEGLFLLPNYEIKDKWFPTNQNLLIEPFEAVIENQEKEYCLKFRNGKIEQLRPAMYMKP